MFAVLLGGHVQGPQHVKIFLLSIYFRLPVPIDVPAVSKNLFPRGFSANFILIIWGVFVAICAYAFLAIFRDILIMPVYEDPIDSYQDVIDKGLIPFAHPGSHYYGEHLANSPNPGYKYLASIYEVPETSAEYWDWFDNDIGVHGIKAFIGISVHCTCLIFSSSAKFITVNIQAGCVHVYSLQLHLLGRQTCSRKLYQDMFRGLSG